MVFLSDAMEPAAEAAPEERLRFRQPGARFVPEVSISPAVVEVKDETSPPRLAKDAVRELLLGSAVRPIPGLGGGVGIIFGGLVCATIEG